MACQEGEIGTKCKQRFKGIENFLRRVAFNLGNSPSQTEVKIISCIPIDVTDLQQKIIHLEKQLEEVNSRGRASATPKPPPTTTTPAVVNTAQITSEYRTKSNHTISINSACNTQSSHTFTQICSKPPSQCEPSICKKSAVSFSIPEMQNECSQIEQEDPPAPINTPCTTTEPSERRFFRKNKKPKKNTHMVYYARTTASPFTEFQTQETPKIEVLNTDVVMNRPYVSQLISKQYGFDDLTGSSQLSAPVCRDEGSRAASCARDCDVCSCCRGHFFDLDLDSQPNLFYNLDQDSLPDRCLDAITPSTMRENIDHGNIFYNSSYYDLIPEKEKPDKVDIENERVKNRPTKIQYANCRPENNRMKSGYHSIKRNYTVYPAAITITRPPVRYAKRRDNLIKRNTSCRNDSSINTIVECGEVYVKPTIVKEPNSKTTPDTTFLSKEVECPDRSVNHTECQTESSKNIGPEVRSLPAAEQNKTESTLNQIKSILQCVLTQVKTNNQVKNQLEGKDKKDAIVQKEPQSNSQECSRILNSFTYSPFAMNPYMASCPRALPSAPCCSPATQQSWSLPQHVSHVPPTHFKCLQNFPVLIQRAPIRQQCSKCIRSGAGHKPAHPKQTSTSTLPQVGLRQNETDNLIKEIYKSVALNIDVPANDASHSDYANLKSVNVDKSTNESGEPIISNVMMTGRRVGTRAQNEKRYRKSPVSTATTSRATSNTRSPLANTSGDQHAMRSRDITSLLRRKAHKSHVNDSDTTPSRKYKPVSRVLHETPSEESKSASETETEADSDHTVVADKKVTKKETEKKGLFSKMFGSIFKKKRMKERREEYENDPTQESEASDSDDYQTIYSQRIERPPKHVSYATERRRITSTRSVARSQRESQVRQRYRRTPYMEQEYRRHWDERLMYHSKSPTTYSSDRAPTRYRSVRTRPPGIYFQHLEARPALIAPCPRPFDRPLSNSDYTNYTPQCTYKQAPRPKKILGTKLSSKRLSWLKRQKLGIRCGEQWKKLILEG